MKSISSIPFSFRALQTEVLFKIALYRYTHVFCNMGGGGGSLSQDFQTQRGKNWLKDVYFEEICGLESWLSFRGKKHFHFSQSTILFFLVQFPGKHLVISSAMCWIRLLSESAGQPHCSRRVDVSEAMLYSIQKSMILVKNWFHPSKLKLNLLLPNINWWVKRRIIYKY